MCFPTTSGLSLSVFPTAAVLYTLSRRFATMPSKPLLPDRFISAGDAASVSEQRTESGISGITFVRKSSRRLSSGSWVQVFAPERQQVKST
jgi:hypothetical protein